MRLLELRVPLRPLALRACERFGHRHADGHLRGLRVERLELLVELAALRVELCLRRIDLAVSLLFRARQFILRTLLQRVTPRLLTLRLHVAFDARDRRRHERVVIVAERVFVLRICEPHDDRTIHVPVRAEGLFERTRRDVARVVVCDRRAECGPRISFRIRQIGWVGHDADDCERVRAVALITAGRSGHIDHVPDTVVRIVRELFGHGDLARRVGKTPLAHIRHVDCIFRAVRGFAERRVETMAALAIDRHTLDMHTDGIVDAINATQRVDIVIGQTHRRHDLHIVQPLLLVEPVRGEERVAAARVDAGEYGHAEHRDDHDRQERLPRAQPRPPRVQQERRTQRLVPCHVSYLTIRYR